MDEPGAPAAKPSEIEMRALGRVSHMRLASAWASVVWFPVALILVSLGASGWALAVLVSGAVFAGVLRMLVATSRCPRCHERYASVKGGLREIWHDQRCSQCGLQRYEH